MPQWADILIIRGVKNWEDNSINILGRSFKPNIGR